MEGYASIGTIYSLRDQYSDKRQIWAVIENNSNDQTSTLAVVEDCSDNGRRVKVSSAWLYEREPIGPILSSNGEIVIEDGKEFIRPLEEKQSEQQITLSKTNKSRTF